MKRHVAFIHTAHAAIPPLMAYFSAAAPEYDIINLLDEGILRFFETGNYRAAEWRFRDLLSVARNGYRAEAALITCSSAPARLVRQLASEVEIPVLKIDAPLAARAVRLANRIGVAATFRATLEPSLELIRDAAVEAGRTVEIIPEVVDDAYRALLCGHPEDHDEMVLTMLDQLAQSGVDAIVLAQVSTARVLPKVRGRYTVPVLSSVDSSLPALRECLPARNSSVSGL